MTTHPSVLAAHDDDTTTPPPTRPGRGLALAVAAGGVLVVAADLIEPHVGSGTKALAEAVAAHPERWLVGYSVQIAAGLLVLAGLTCFTRLAPGRGAGLARAGAWVFVAGMVGYACQAATELMLVPVVGDDASRQGVLDAVDRMDQSAALVIVFLLYLPGVLFGPLLLAAGLARAGLISWWLAGAMGATTVAGFALTGSPAGTLSTAAQMALLTAAALRLISRPTSGIADA